MSEFCVKENEVVVVGSWKRKDTSSTLKNNRSTLSSHTTEQTDLLAIKHSVYGIILPIKRKYS